MPVVDMNEYVFLWVVGGTFVTIGVAYSAAALLVKRLRRK